MSFFTKNPNGQTMTPSSPSPTRTTHTQSPSMIVTGTSGKQYSLDNNTVSWIKSRYKQDMANSYGLDDADQLAKRNGQLSASALKTYKNSNVDRQLAELGLPSEKNLEKYLESYNQWHTGGMDQYFGQANLPKDYWTKTKGWYQADMQNAYENTAEDQQRKARGLMPSKWEAKYTDTEIDDQLRARGLPPISEFNTYAQRYSNYQGIENFYANVAHNETNLRLAGIKDDDTAQTYGGEEKTGHDFYVEAFFNELNKKNEDGSYVYAPIRGMFKNSAKPSSAAPTGDYAYDLGAGITAENKDAASDEDYASYKAFSYDDYKKHYDDLYNRYFANQKTESGQLVSDALAVQAREADEEAARSFYDPKEGEELAFIQQWRKENPNGTSEDMFTDMIAHNSPMSTVRRVQKEARAPKNKGVITGNKNYTDDGWGWYDIGDGLVKSLQAADNSRKQKEEATSFTSAAATSVAEKEPSNVKEPEMDGGWTFPDEQAKDRDAVGAALRDFDVAKESGNTAGMYRARKTLESLGFNYQTAYDDAKKWYFVGDTTANEPVAESGQITTKDYYTPVGIDKDELGELTTEDAARIVEYYMEENGGWNYKNATDAFSYLRAIGVQDDTVTNAARDMQARYGSLPEASEETAYEQPEKETRVQDGKKSAEAFIDATLKEQGEDEKTISATADAIRNPIAAIIDEADSVDVDTVLSVLDQVSKLSSTNYTAMKNALLDLGFDYGEFEDWAGDITAGWSDADKQKLRYALFDYMSGIDMAEPKEGEYASYIDEKVAGELGDGAIGDHFVQNRPLDAERFEAAVEWAQQQIESGERTEWEAYQVLAAMGLQNEMQTYMPEEWHRAHFLETAAPGLWSQAEETDRLLYEAMSPEEQREANLKLWNDLSAEKKAAIYDSPYWWEADPNVYRTFGQSLKQQMSMVLPGLAAEIVATPVTILDAVGANISGRPEMWESTQWLKDLQAGIAQYGSTYDNVNGAKAASVVADVTQELARMTWYGNIGGAIGAGFAGTKAGAAVLAGSASSSAVVKGASNMFMSMVRSSPFVASAFANNYSEVKALGASNKEATWFGLITGLSEGLLEGFEFDNLWGKVLGQKNFAATLALGKNTYLERLGIIGKAWISSAAVSGLGEFTEESIGYVLETFLKMRHSDTWGKGTDWNTSDWLQQAMMGFITGALGGGLAAGGSFVSDGVKLANAMKNNPQLQAALPDILTGQGIANGLPEAAMATYRDGGAEVMSKENYGNIIDQIADDYTAIFNAANLLDKTKAEAKAEYDTKVNEINATVSSAVGANINDSGKLSEFVKKCKKLGVSIDFDSIWNTDPQTWAAQIQERAQAAKQNALDNARAEYETALSKADADFEGNIKQKQRLIENNRKKIQEHYVGLYLQNEDLINSLSDEMLDNLAQAYQNGAQYDPQATAERREQGPRPVDGETGAVYNKTGQEEMTNGRAGKEPAPGGDAGVSGQAVPGNNQVLSGEGRNGRANPRWIESVPITEKAKANGIDPVDMRTDNHDPSSFHAAIGEAKANNDHGAFVDQHSVDEYGDMQTFMSADGGVGVAVKSDGDIVSVFKNPQKNQSKKSSTSILFTALENGGKKLDNFNSNVLSQIYLQHGFVPVARIAFNDDYAPDGWNYERDGRPDILFWVHNGDDANTILDKMGTYEMPDVESLPLFEGEDAYDKAAAYRDTLVNENTGWTTQQENNVRKLTDDEVAKVQQAVKDIKYKGDVVFIDDPNAEDAWIDSNGTITINRANISEAEAKELADNPGWWLLKHEFTHFTEGTAEYEAYSNAVQDILRRKFGDNYGRVLDAIKQDYAQHGRMLDDAGVVRELVAKFSQSGDILNNAETINAFVREQGTVADRIYNWIRYKINDLKLRRKPNSAVARELLKAERLYAQAYRAANRKAPSYKGTQLATGRSLDSIAKEYVGVANPRTGVTAEDDEAYMRAARAGDTETTGRMVRELFERLGLIRAYRGEKTPAGSWTKVDIDNRFNGVGVFAATDKETARAYTKNGNTDEGIMNLYMKFDNANRHDAGGEEWDNIQLNSPKGVTVYRIDVVNDPDDENSTTVVAYPIDDTLDSDYSSASERAAKSVTFTSTDDMDYSYKLENAFKELFGQDSNVIDFFNMYADWNDDGYTMKVGVHNDTGEYVPPELFPDAETISADELAVRDKAAGHDGTIISNVFDNGPTATTDLVAFNPNYIKFADPITYDDNGNIIPLSQRGDFTRNELRYSTGRSLNDLLNEYGAIEQGREPRARDVEVPKQTNDQNRVSQWIRSLVESGKLTDDQAQNVLRMVVEQDYGTYVPTSQAERMEEARAYIAERQPLQAQQEFHDMVMQGKFGVKTNALGIQLLSDASARGDFASVLDIAADLQLAATEAGQSAQIFNVLKELKGVGSAWYMQKVIDRMNSKYADKIKSGKMQRISVDPALMAQLAQATTVDQIAAAEEAVAKDIARQLPLTWDDRLSSWRYFSMLANPTTHIRNITGNLLMKGLNTAKDAVATGLENVLGVDQSERAHALLTAADKRIWGNWVQQSYEEQARNLSGGSKLGFESFVKQNMRSFDNKFINALAQFNFKALENEDIAFIKPAYKNALMQYMKAQGYTLNEKGQAGKVDAKGQFREMTKAQMNEAIDWASQQAWKQTFRDASSLATMLNKLSKENAVSRLLIEGVMPFKKTPINIAKRGIEYSPAGIIMGIAQLTNGVKKGKVTTAQAIDNLASGLTGSALMALGVMLAKLGVIRAGGEKDKKLETFLEDTGDQTYAVKFGDKSINMSSIAPATIPLFMGVALNEMIEQGGDSLDLSTITDTIAGTLNPFMEMSFMSSLNSALKNYNANGIGGALGSTLMTAAQNYGSQYLPTLGGKIAQFLDPTRRTTKSDITSPVGSNMDYYARSLAKKVPGLESTLQPDVDVWGRTDTKDSFSEWAWDFANKFILPTNVKVTNRDAVDNELIRVVESTGVTDFLPSDGAKYFTVNKVKYEMNAKQYSQYSQDRGQAAYAALKDVMASASYKTASDEQKATMLKKALDAAYKQVGNQWKEKLGAYGK